MSSKSNLQLSSLAKFQTQSKSGASLSILTLKMKKGSQKIEHVFGLYHPLNRVFRENRLLIAGSSAAAACSTRFDEKKPFLA